MAAASESTTGKIRTVLIGTDLDKESDALVRAGSRVARAAGAKVQVVHAFSPPFGYFSELGAGIDPSIVAAEELRSKEALAAQVHAAGIAQDELVSATVQTGAPHKVLPDLAAAGADLLVIGATAGGRLHRRLGSTADRVLRRAVCPVLVVRGELNVPPRKVLAPVDLSPLSAEAFGAGLRMLSEIEGGSAAELEALFVLSVVQRQVSPQFTPEQIDRFAAEELKRFVAAHAGRAAERVRQKVRAGNTREEILAEIDGFRPDVVLLGTHGIGGFDRFVIGSVAADIAREAPCSVLVVPPVAMREGDRG